MQRPNFIVIMADDMGYSDIGCYGSEIRTPHLDGMARRGLRFSQMYNAARCCPTRASLLTGLYPHQAGVGDMINPKGTSRAYQGYLAENTPTIAEVLRTRGYRNYYAGKWHASPGLPIQGDPARELGSPTNPTPRSRGFDRFFGTLAGAGSFFNPHGLMDQDRRVNAWEYDDFYYTDQISERACTMIDEAARDQQPFFLHVCYTAPHWPLHARPETIETYRDTYHRGWDYFRTARHEALKGMGMLDARWPISPRDPLSRDFKEDNAERRAWESLRMAVYAAQIESMDAGIGRLLERLRAQGQEDNTYVLFLSDNGGCAEFLNEDGDGRSWPSFYRHSALPGETCTVGNIPGLDPGPSTTFMSYDLPWANASNAPFRLYKHWVHEGGIATPLVVQGPGISDPGGIVHHPCHIIDIMSTCVDASGARHPDTFAGQPSVPLEGQSLLPLLRGETPAEPRTLYWEHERNAAVREGCWKMVRQKRGPWELYNLEEDRTELNNLVGGEKDRLRRLTALYDSWAERVGVEE